MDEFEFNLHQIDIDGYTVVISDGGVSVLGDGWHFTCKITKARNVKNLSSEDELLIAKAAVKNI